MLVIGGRRYLLVGLGEGAYYWGEEVLISGTGRRCLLLGLGGGACY